MNENVKNEYSVNEVRVQFRFSISVEPQVNSGQLGFVFPSAGGAAHALRGGRLVSRGAEKSINTKRFPLSFQFSTPQLQILVWC
jgi:hypothetical protein